MQCILVYSSAEYDLLLQASTDFKLRQEGNTMQYTHGNHKSVRELVLRACIASLTRTCHSSNGQEFDLTIRLVISSFAYLLIHP